MDLAYELVWINTYTIFCAWKPLKGSKSETMAIPIKHIYFAKDDLTCIAAVENVAKNGNETEDEDGGWYFCRVEPKLRKIYIRFLIKYMTLGSNPIFEYTL